MPLAVVYNTMNSDLDAITDDDKILIMDYIASFQEDDLFCQEEISDIKKLENRILSSLGSSMKPEKQNPKDTKKMMQKYEFSTSFNDRVFEIIKNHHWLKEYNTKEINENDVAAKFRRSNDFKIAKIMAQADLKGVSENFYARYSSALNKENLALVQNSIDDINYSGQMIFASKIVDKSKIPTVDYKGNSYKVIDLLLSAEMKIYQNMASCQILRMIQSD